MKKKLQEYYSSINNTFNLNNNRITNVANAEKKNDLINKQQLEDILNNMFYKTFVPLTGTIPEDPIRDTVVLNNTNIVNIKDPSNENELVNLRTLENINTSLLPLTGNTSDDPITGQLVFNNSSTFSNLSNPVKDLDIVNLLSVKKAFAKDLSKHGGNLKGTLDANNQSITGIKDPNNPADAVPLNYINTINNNSCLKLSGNSKDTPITGNLVFNNTASIYGLEHSTGPTDAVNLSTLQTEILHYLTAKGGILKGSIDANNNTILNIADPIKPNDAVNLQYLNSQTSLHLSINKSKSLLGSLNMNHNKLTSLRSPSEPKDGVPFLFLKNYLRKQFSKYIPLFGNFKDNFNFPSSLSHLISGNLIFDNKSTITQFSSPEHPEDAVNLLTLSNTANKYLNLFGGTLKGKIDMSSHIITNVSSATQAKNLVNIGLCHSSIDTFKDKYILLRGNSESTPIIGNFIFNKTATITGFSHPNEASDAVNLLTLTVTANKFFLLSGGSVKGNITLTNSGKITQLSNPSDPQDGVNLQTLNTKTNKYLDLKGGSLKGDIYLTNSGKIIEIADPKNPTDAVNLKILNQITINTNNNYISLQGTLKAYPITGNLIFDNTHTITGLANPDHEFDIVNLQTLTATINKYFPLDGNEPLQGSLHLSKNKIVNLSGSSLSTDAINFSELTIKTSKYLKLSGGIMSGPINCSKGITGIKTPLTDDEPVNLNYFNQSLKSLLNKYLPITGTTIHSPISGNLVFDSKHTLTGLSNPSKPTDIVNLQYLKDTANKYLPLSGGKMEGDINANSQSVTSSAIPTHSQDAVNLQSFNQMLSSSCKDYIPLSGTTTASPISGNLVFDSKHTLTGLSNPSKPTDIVNLQYLQDTANKYLPLSGGKMEGNINANSQSVTSSAIPTHSQDAVNLQSFNQMLSSSCKDYIPLSGTTTASPISGNLVFDSKHTLTGLSNPSKPTDIVNLQYLQDTANKYLPLSGGKMEGNINANSQSITSSATPTHSQDAVNLKYLNGEATKYLSLSGGKMEGDINANSQSVTSSATPTHSQDAVNLQSFNQMFSSSCKDYILLSGTTTASPISGNLVFDSKHTLTGLSNPSKPTDIVNLQYLQDTANKYLPLSGGKMEGNINANSQSITSSAIPTQSQDAVNLQSFNQMLSSSCKDYILLSGTTTASPISGNLVFDSKHTLTGLSNPSHSKDIVNLQYLQDTANKYLPLSGGKMEGDINANFQDISVTSSTKDNAVTNISMLNDAFITTFYNNCVNIKGNDGLGSKIINNLVFDSKHTLTGLSNPSKPTDIVNLQYLQDTANKYLPLSGGKMEGNINANSQSITSSAIPTHSQDAVNLQSFNQMLSSSCKDYILLSGTTTASPISGNLVFDSKHTLTGLSNPSHPKDIVNLQYLQDTANKYLPLSGGKMEGDINANSQSVTSSATPIHSQDAVNLKYLNSEAAKYLPLSGGKMEGGINVNFKIVYSQVSTEDSAATNLQSLNTAFVNSLDSLCVPLKGNKNSKLITGNLIFDSKHTLTGLSNPSHPKDIVNLQYLQDTANKYLPLSGGKMEGDINANSQSVTSSATPIHSQDAVNLKYLNSEAAKYLPLSGGKMEGAIDMNQQKLTITSNTTTPTSAINLGSFNELLNQYVLKTGTINGKPITGNIFFNNSATITDFTNPSQNLDIVNLQTLQTNAKNYLPLSGGTMAGNINMGGHKIINVSTPSEKDLNALVPISLVSKLNSYNEVPYLIRRRNSTKMNLKVEPWGFSGKNVSWTSSSDALSIASSNASSYFSFSKNGYDLNILKPGVYYICISFAIEHSPGLNNYSTFNFLLQEPNQQSYQCITQSAAFYHNSENSFSATFSVPTNSSENPWSIGITNDRGEEASINFFSWSLIRLANNYELN